MSKWTQIGTETIDGQDYPISVSDDGTFRATLDGDDIDAVTKKQVIDKLRAAVRTHKRVNVPATLLTKPWPSSERKQPTVMHVTLTGIHGSNRNVLWKEDKAKGKGENGQLSRSDRECFRRLTPDEVEAFRELWRAKVDAERALEKWEDKHRLNPHAAVEGAAAELLKGGADA